MQIRVDRRHDGFMAKMPDVLAMRPVAVDELKLLSRRGRLALPQIDRAIESPP